MKFPVFRSVGETFAFLFANPLNILKIIWAPALLLGVANVLILPRYFAEMTAFMSLGPQSDPDQLAPAAMALMPDMLTLLAFYLIAYPVLAAGLLKLVLLNEKPPRIAYLGFGLEELRIIGTWALIFLILFALVFLGQITGGAARAMGQLGGNVGQAVGIVIDGAILAITLWIGVRLSMATPAAVAEQRVGVGPAWAVTRGALFSLLGFWAIFGVAGFMVESLMFQTLTPQLAALAQEAAATEDADLALDAWRRLNEATAATLNWAEPANLARFIFQHLVGITMASIATVAAGVAWKRLRAAA